MFIYTDYAKTPMILVVMANVLLYFTLSMSIVVLKNFGFMFKSNTSKDI